MFIQLEKKIKNKDFSSSETREYFMQINSFISEELLKIKTLASNHLIKQPKQLNKNLKLLIHLNFEGIIKFKGPIHRK